MSRTIHEAAVVRRAFVLHAIALLTGLGAVVFAAGESLRGDGVLFCAGLVLGWLVGVPLSLSRLRPWAFFVGGLVAAWVMALGTSLGVHDDGVRSALHVFVALWSSTQFGAASSYALLAPRLDLGALWLPLGLHVAAAITWLNRHGAVSTWHDDKLAVWDAPSAGLVALGVVFFVAMLAARQRVSRARWASAGARVDGAGADGGARSRIVLLGALLAVVVLAVAPFLLRTRAGCEDCTAEATRHADPVPTAAPRADPLQPDELRATWRRFVGAAADVACTAALVGAIGLVAGVAALPVLRRRRLRALAEPRSSLPPTERVRHRFRRALVALHELGVVVDDALVAPRGLLSAVTNVNDAACPRGLVDAVAVWEQVCFGGRGLPEDAEARMARAMADVVAWARQRRSVWQTVSSSFRLPSP